MELNLLVSIKLNHNVLQLHVCCVQVQKSVKIIHEIFMCTKNIKLITNLAIACNCCYK